jgi:hypothetical protein
VVLEEHPERPLPERAQGTIRAAGFGPRERHVPGAVLDASHTKYSPRAGFGY